MPHDWGMETDGEKTRGRLLAQIDAFLKAQDMSEREFGLRAASNHKFVARLRDRDVGVTLTVIERAEAFMQKIEASNSEAA